MNVLPSEWSSEVKDVVSSFEDTEMNKTYENTSVSVVFDNTINTQKIMGKLSEDVLKKTELEFDFNSNTVIFKYLSDLVRTNVIDSDVVNQILSEDIPEVLEIETEFEITKDQILVSEDSEDLRNILSKDFGPNVCITNIVEDNTFPIEYGHLIPEEGMGFMDSDMGIGRVIDVVKSLEFECSECETEPIDTEMRDNMNVWVCTECGYSSEIEGNIITNISGDSTRSEIEETVVSSMY